MKVGNKVSYTFYGVPEIAIIIRIGETGTILFLDNGRWMHATSVTVVK